MVDSKKAGAPPFYHLRARVFAGMLPPTMSQGNDAFSSKDAETDATKAASSEVADASASKKDEAPETSVSKDDASKSGKASTDAKSSRADAQSDEDARTLASGNDENDEDEGESESANDEKRRRESKDSPRNRRRGSASKRTSRDEEDEDQEEPPQTEEALDVPKMQTVYMLGAMSVLTIICWFAAKLTCNVHPDLVREPKHFSTKDLAADPKNAAFEFHHKFETGDFTTALDLATGEIRPVVEAKLKECEQSPDPCAKNLARLSGTIFSSGKVLEQKGDRATVELLSESQSWPGRKTFSFEVVKEGDYWRVASRREVPTRAPAAAAASATAAEAPAVPPAQPGRVVESPDQQIANEPAN